MAQRLYDLLIKYDTWNMSIQREAPDPMWFDPNTLHIPERSTILRINLEINTGGESGPTPYVRR